MEGKIDKDWCTSAELRTLYRAVVVKWRSWIYVPVLTCGHEVWVMTRSTRSQIQVIENELSQGRGFGHFGRRPRQRPRTHWWAWFTVLSQE